MAISTRFLLLLSFLCCLSQTACAVTETVPCGNEPMYQNGSLSVAIKKVQAGVGTHCCSLLVAIPDDADLYPVVQFQHGFKLQNSDYTGLISQIASWGFIVVAPQMYGVIATNVTTEITNARSIFDWMKEGPRGGQLIASLPIEYANHRLDFKKVALAGHSRGGHVAFGLALKYCNTLPQDFSAVVGLDPVDGTNWLSPPPILTQEESSLNVSVPTLIVGTGYGSMGGMLPPCAPTDLGHVNFYRVLTPASFHFVANNSGHMDFTDDCTGLERLWAEHCWHVCKSGPSRQCMRQFSAGITVAFLQAVLLHNNTSFSAALHEPQKAPVNLTLPVWKGNISGTSEAHLEYADI